MTVRHPRVVAVRFDVGVPARREAGNGTNGSIRHLAVTVRVADHDLAAVGQGVVQGSRQPFSRIVRPAGRPRVQGLELGEADVIPTPLLCNHTIKHGLRQSSVGQRPMFSARVDPENRCSSSTS